MMIFSEGVLAMVRVMQTTGPGRIRALAFIQMAIEANKGTFGKNIIALHPVLKLIIVHQGHFSFFHMISTTD
jgi:hypothetical protein